MEKFVPHIATKVNAVKPFVFRTEFADGKVTEFDVRLLFDEFPVFKQLSDEKLFSEMKLDPLGVSIVWNDEIDLSSDGIYQRGDHIGKVDPDLKLIVGQAIADARGKKGMSQRDLSASSGVMQADISKIEKGKGNPTLTTLQKIAKSLGRTVASFLM